MNLLRYAAWLTLEYPGNTAGGTQDYEEKKRRAAQRSAEKVRAAQDIGELPEVADAARRAAVMDSFRVFCETYFHEIFYTPST